MGIQYVLDKMKLKVQLNRYLSQFDNMHDYETKKKILDAYCFNYNLFETIVDSAKEAGTERLVQHEVDAFEEYRSRFEVNHVCEKDTEEEDIGLEE